MLGAGAVDLELRLGEPAHPTAGLPIERKLLPAADEPESEPQDGGSVVGYTGIGVHTKLDFTSVLPLPDLVVEPSLLEVAVEGVVVPAEHPSRTAVDDSLLVVHVADAHADV